MVLLLLFGYVLTLDVDRVPLAVWDRSRTPESRELVSRFEGSRYFEVALRAAGYPEVEEAIDDGRVLAALVIPEDFAGRVRSDRPSIVQLLLDGSEANTATIALGYAETVVSGYSADLEVRWAQATGLQGLRRPLDVRSRVWFNTDLESRNFIVPGLIAVIMMIIAALLTSLTVAREWEQGTMEQLIATPVTGPGTDPGQAPPVLRHRDGGPGRWRWRWGSTSSTCRCAEASPSSSGSPRSSWSAPSSLGMLFSIVARSQLLASQMAMVFTFLPAFLLSGFVFSIDNMPPVIRAVTYLVPSRYFVTLLKGIYLKGAGLEIAGRGQRRCSWSSGRQWCWPRPGCSARSSGREEAAPMLERVRHMLVKEFLQVFRDPQMLRRSSSCPRSSRSSSSGTPSPPTSGTSPPPSWTSTGAAASRDLLSRFFRLGLLPPRPRDRRTSGTPRISWTAETAGVILHIDARVRGGPRGRAARRSSR